MKLSKILIISGSIVLFLIANCSCCKTNNSNAKIQGASNVAVSSEIDSLPSFEYLGIHRELIPAKQKIHGETVYSRDTLLSLYLEDNIHCENYCEGIFQYAISLYIDESGVLEEIVFKDDKYNSEELIRLIISELRKIKFYPAKNYSGEYIPLQISVNVLIDLYNNPSLLRKEVSKRYGIK